MKILRALRESRGDSQQAIADYLGISRQAYSNYETGAREPDFENLLKLGEYFNCSIDYLLRGDDAKKEPDVKSGISDDDLKFALFGTTEIDDETYDDVKAYAKFKKEQRKR